VEEHYCFFSIFLYLCQDNNGCCQEREKRKIEIERESHHKNRTVSSHFCSLGAATTTGVGVAAVAVGVATASGVVGTATATGAVGAATVLFEISAIKPLF
jgi:hypothetical protein